MHAQERQPPSPGIGVDAGGIASAARNEFDARPDKTVRNLEIGRRAIHQRRAPSLKILCQDCRDGGIVAQSVSIAFV
jgi:hypothetical protein